MKKNDKWGRIFEESEDERSKKREKEREKSRQIRRWGGGWESRNTMREIRKGERVERRKRKDGKRELNGSWRKKEGARG